MRGFKWLPAARNFLLSGTSVVPSAVVTRIQGLFP